MRTTHPILRRHRRARRGIADIEFVLIGGCLILLFLLARGTWLLVTSRVVTDTAAYADMRSHTDYDRNIPIIGDDINLLRQYEYYFTSLQVKTTYDFSDEYAPPDWLDISEFNSSRYNTMAVGNASSKSIKVFVDDAHIYGADSQGFLSGITFNRTVVTPATPPWTWSSIGSDALNDWMDAATKHTPGDSDTAALQLDPTP